MVETMVGWYLSRGVDSESVGFLNGASGCRNSIPMNYLLPFSPGGDLKVQAVASRWWIDPLAEMQSESIESKL